MAKKKMPILDQPIKGRICWSCEHVRFSVGEAGYSEYTPGSDFGLACGKGYWEFDNYGDGLDQFREKLESAEQCAAFQERKVSR